ncbi:MAG: lectin-like protein [Candidatus Limivicinus sp.]|nr:lectin-like protein [Clostridiales bacterium]MDY3860536.1 lectin-like protein [Candidatus Limivicinus sp.]
MANPVFDPAKVLGLKLTKMDRQELCEFVSALCRTVVAEVGSRGRRGGIYPDNISVDDSGGIAVGPAGQSPWEGQELQFIAPELYWNGQLSAASDVYSVGMLMYYAVNGGHLPLEDECENAQLRRMNGEDYPAPKIAGRRLGSIIEKCIRFKAADRYQTLDELRAVLDSCIKNLYLSGVPSAEAIFKKSDDDLDDIERMMIGIIEKGDGDESRDAPDAVAEDVKVYAPAHKQDGKNAGKAPISPEQTEMLARKFKAQGSPAVPKLTEEKNPELAPVNPTRQPVKTPAVQYTRNAERERKIAEEVKKRRRRPLAVILVLCAVLIMVAIVINAMLKDFQQAKQQPDNVSTAPTGTVNLDPYANTPSPTPDAAAAVSAAPGLELGTDAPPEAASSAQPETSAAPAEHSYQVFREDISWTEAAKKCQDLGGHLVVISDEAEFDEIVALAEANGISRVWIGLHRENGHEVWVNGQDGYVRWAKGEPSYVDVNDQVSEDYVMLWDNRGWAYNDNRDDPCKDYPAFYSGTMGYICEFGD